MQLGAALPELMQDRGRFPRDCSKIQVRTSSPVYVQRPSGGATELARSGHLVDGSGKRLRLLGMNVCPAGGQTAVYPGCRCRGAAPAVDCAA
jgi:hypothetical protein